MELSGVPYMGNRETTAVEALGYEPADVVYLISSTIGSNIETTEEGYVRVVDEGFAEKTPEMWAAVLGVDGNEPDEDGTLPDEVDTLVRII